MLWWEEGEDKWWLRTPCTYKKQRALTVFSMEKYRYDTLFLAALHLIDIHSCLLRCFSFINTVYALNVFIASHHSLSYTFYFQAYIHLWTPVSICKRSLVMVTPCVPGGNPYRLVMVLWDAWGWWCTKKCTLTVLCVANLETLYLQEVLQAWWLHLCKFNTCGGSHLMAQT